VPDQRAACQCGEKDPNRRPACVDAVDAVDAPALNDSAEVEPLDAAHKPGVVPFPTDTEGVKFE